MCIPFCIFGGEYSVVFLPGKRSGILEKHSYFGI
ncbi:hypothetical protein T01_13663 [Trichinella spiralis]|uniref:Uncharacterized protein n=1 Tax=Trichinella spiralis TaxID=6334 RepID=A0A0V0YYM5_TRISP|nr:hypothetical protein T01_13663 [Trichinella spiralis]